MKIAMAKKGVSAMECSMRLTRIRILEKMNEQPEMSRKLGLKDMSYIKKGTRAFQKGGPS